MRINTFLLVLACALLATATWAWNPFKTPKLPLEWQPGHYVEGTLDEKIRECKSMYLRRQGENTKIHAVYFRGMTHGVDDDATGNLSKSTHTVILRYTPKTKFVYAIGLGYTCYRTYTEDYYQDIRNATLHQYLYKSEPTAEEYGVETARVYRNRKQEPWGTLAFQKVKDAGDGLHGMVIVWTINDELAEINRQEMAQEAAEGKDPRDDLFR